MANQSNGNNRKNNNSSGNNDSLKSRLEKGRLANLNQIRNKQNKNEQLANSTTSNSSSNSSKSKPSLGSKGLPKEGLDSLKQKALSAIGNKTSGQTNSASGEEETASSQIGSAISGAAQSFWAKLPATVKLKVIGIGAGVIAALFLLIVLIALLAAPMESVTNFFSGIGDSVSNFFSGLFTDESEREKEIDYYNTLKEAQEKAYSKYHVCVDVNLIDATLRADRLVNEQVGDADLPCEDAEGDSCEENSDVVDSVDYDKMKQYVDLLANMQIKRTKYLKLDSSCYHYDARIEEDGCTAQGEGAITIPVTNENMSCINDGFWGSLGNFFSNVPHRDSSTPRLIARNDLVQQTIYLTPKKAALKERNYEYLLYVPSASYIENEEGELERSCNPNAIPSEDESSLSVGTYDDYKDNIYYWNLLDSFIEEYYDPFLETGSDYAQEGTERFEKADDMIKKIYLYYDTLGPSRDCSEVYAYQTISNLCTDGVTVVGNHAGTYDLEEYIAGVVEAEMYSHFPMESKKALAVAARTYVMVSTNYCEQAIDNSSNAQNFNPNYSAESWQAAESTRGEILTENGRAFLAEYDSWDCPGSLTCTYKRLPSGETHIVAISDTYARLAAGGHGRGMSQIAAADMANQGYGYKEILSYFYNGTLAISTGGSGQSVMNGTRDEKLAFLFPDGLPTSSAEMQQYLTRVNVPLVDINGNSRTGTLTVHQAIASDVVNAFTEIAASGFPIKDAYCYSWRGMAGNRQTTSHHSYGVACDINANENYMIRDGSVVAGSLWQPGVNPYSIEANGPVVQAFSKYGWIWGGSWNSSKDYMHFSFTGY